MCFIHREYAHVGELRFSRCILCSRTLELYSSTLNGHKCFVFYGTLYYYDLRSHSDLSSTCEAVMIDDDAAEGLLAASSSENGQRTRGESWMGEIVGILLCRREASTRQVTWSSQAKLDVFS